MEIAHVVKRRVAQRIPEVHQRPRFEQCVYALRTAINRSHVKRRSSRRGVDPIDKSSRNHVLIVLSLRVIRGQTMAEPIYVIRRCREVDEPREQCVMGRGCLRAGP